MTYQPGEQPYSQPQDPWSGTQGMASAPTDPIPAPPAAPAERNPQAVARPARQYTPGVAAPGVWVQETVAHDDRYGAGGRGGGRGGLYVLVVLLVVVLGGAGGFGAWWAITNYAGGPADPSASNSTGPTSAPTSTPAPTETPVTEAGFDLVVAGACMINRGTGTQPDMRLVPCDWPGELEVVQVLKVERGAAIPENDAGKLGDESAESVCGELPRFNLYYAWDSSNDDRDLLACLTRDVTAS